MRVAVIGVGSMGFNHLRVYSELDGVQIVGSPGKVVRELSPEEIAKLAKSAAHYVDNAQRYRIQLKAL